MSKHNKKYKKYVQKKAFTSPGTLEYVGKDVPFETVVKLIEFDDEICQQKIVKSIIECQFSTIETHVNWLNVDGLHEVHIVEEIGKL
jgi:magnesium transporter